MLHTSLNFDKQSLLWNSELSTLCFQFFVSFLSFCTFILNVANTKSNRKVNSFVTWPRMAIHKRECIHPELLRNQDFWNPLTCFNICACVSVYLQTSTLTRIVSLSRVPVLVRVFFYLEQSITSYFLLWDGQSKQQLTTRWRSPAIQYPTGKCSIVKCLINYWLVSY